MPFLIMCFKLKILKKSIWPHIRICVSNLIPEIYSEEIYIMLPKKLAGWRKIHNDA